MRQADYGPGFWRKGGLKVMIGTVVNIWLIVVGFFFLGVGTYASVQSIVNGYASSAFGGAFTCESNALAPAVTPSASAVPAAGGM